MSAVDPRTSGTSRWRRLVAAAAVGLVAALGTVLGVGSPAAAHGQFVTSDPVPGSQVTTALQMIYVFFTEKPTSNAYFAMSRVITPSARTSA